MVSFFATAFAFFVGAALRVALVGLESLRVELRRVVGSAVPAAGTRAAPELFPDAVDFFAFVVFVGVVAAFLAAVFFAAVVVFFAGVFFAGVFFAGDLFAGVC